MRDDRGWGEYQRNKEQLVGTIREAIWQMMEVDRGHSNK